MLYYVLRMQRSLCSWWFFTLFWTWIWENSSFKLRSRVLLRIIFANSSGLGFFAPTYSYSFTYAVRCLKYTNTLGCAIYRHSSVYNSFRSNVTFHFSASKFLKSLEKLFSTRRSEQENVRNAWNEDRNRCENVARGGWEIGCLSKFKNTLRINVKISYSEGEAIIKKH